MGKKRVYELAKELGLDNKTTISRLKALGIDVASHSSTVDDVDASTLIQSLEKERKGIQSGAKAPLGIIRRRPKKEEPAPEAPPPPIVEEKPPEPAIEEKPAIIEIVEEPQPEPKTEPEEKPVEQKPPEPVEIPATPVVEIKTEPEQKPAPVPEAPPAKPKREHRFGLKIVGPPIPINQLESRGGFRPPVPPQEEKPKVPVETEIPVSKKLTPEEIMKAEKEKAPKKKGLMRRMKELDRREIFSEAELGVSSARSKRKVVKRTIGKTEITTPKAIKRIVRMDKDIQIAELARRMGIKAGEIIKKLIGLGTMATINDNIDFDTAVIIAQDYEWEVQHATEDMEQTLEQGREDSPESLKPRPPVVTVMGHVDHGKTSLLDAIRSTNKVEQEAGGITQHIGAYRVSVPRGTITFLDTPGHEAFSEMRARGAQLTDIVVLVVAADDGIQPQTVEAINHAKEAGVPIIVAINKIDKPDAQPERVKQSLTEHGLLTEEWGGETLMTLVSAKKKEGIDELLEQILLQAEMLELSANPDKSAKGVVIEARLDKGRGPIVTALIKEGTLKIGDPVVAGQYFGKVRAMLDEYGQQVQSAGPSTPVEVIGLTGVPMAGDNFHAVESERLGRDVAEQRAREARLSSLSKTAKPSLETLLEGLGSEEAKNFKIVLKTDVQGSASPIGDALTKLSTDKVKIKIIHSAVGGITESDINLASASGAIVIGFNVRPEAAAQELSSKEGVQVKTYNVIYDLIEDVRKAASGLLAPRIQEKYLGRALIKQIFNLPKVGVIAGCSVTDGKITRQAGIRLLRDSVVVHQGKLGSLKHFKDDVREVTSGKECGLSIENFGDIKPGDQIEAFESQVIEQTI